MKKSRKIKKLYQYIGNVSEGKIAVGNKATANSKELKYGFTDEDGFEIVSLKYDIVWDYYEGFARVCILKNKKPYWGIIDAKGKELISCEHKSILPIDNKLFYIKSNDEDTENKWGAINIENFELVLPFIYDWLFPVREEIVIYRIADKYGAVHQSGKEIIPAEYDNLKFFSEGLCAAKLNGKWGYLNKKNEIVIPFEYKHVWPFEKGIAQVYRESEYSMLERKDYIDKI